MLGSIIDKILVEDVEANIIEVVGSGSCLTNAILQGFSKEYIRSENQRTQDKIMRNVNERIFSHYFGKISDDEVNEFLGNNIMTHSSVKLYQEVLRKNIYVLTIEEELEEIPDEELDLYAKRSVKKDVLKCIKYLSSYEKSLCLFLKDNHFDLVGIMENGVMKTHFPSNHNFICVLENLLSKQEM